MRKEEFELIIKKYKDGKASPEEKELFEKFFDSFQREDEIPIFSGDLKDEMWGNIEKETSRSVPVTTHRRFSYWGVAAVIAIFLLSVAAFFFLSSETEETKIVTVTTEYGQIRKLSLSDGTRIVLNAGSKLTYSENFIAEVRNVQLSGEAYFEVAHDEARPFHVITKDSEIEVLGTTFNVQAYPENQFETVSLIEGKVGITSGTTNAILAPQEQWKYDRLGGKATKYGFETEKILDWQGNELFFDDMALKEVVRRLERRFAVSFVIKNKNLGECKVRAKMETRSLNTVLEALKFAMNLTYDVQYEDGKAVLVELDGKSCNQ